MYMNILLDNQRINFVFEYRTIKTIKQLRETDVKHHVVLKK